MRAAIIGLALAACAGTAEGDGGESETAPLGSERVAAVDAAACGGDAVPGDVETVTLRYDVTPEGEVVNVAAIEATDPCYAPHAMNAAREWRYQPKLVNGEPVFRRGVTVKVRFDAGERAE